MANAKPVHDRHSPHTRIHDRHSPQSQLQNATTTRCYIRRRGKNHTTLADNSTNLGPTPRQTWCFPQKTKRKRMQKHMPCGMSRAVRLCGCAARPRCLYYSIYIYASISIFMPQYLYLYLLSVFISISVIISRSISTSVSVYFCIYILRVLIQEWDVSINIALSHYTYRCI